jgi:hypothetical protein
MCFLESAERLVDYLPQNFSATHTHTTPTPTPTLTLTLTLTPDRLGNLYLFCSLRLLLNVLGFVFVGVCLTFFPGSCSCLKPPNQCSVPCYNRSWARNERCLYEYCLDLDHTK